MGSPQKMHLSPSTMPEQAGKERQRKRLGKQRNILALMGLNTGPGSVRKQSWTPAAAGPWGHPTNPMEKWGARPTRAQQEPAIRARDVVPPGFSPACTPAYRPAPSSQVLLTPAVSKPALANLSMFSKCYTLKHSEAKQSAVSNWNKGPPTKCGWNDKVLNHTWLKTYHFNVNLPCRIQYYHVTCNKIFQNDCVLRRYGTALMFFPQEGNFT